MTNPRPVYVRVNANGHSFVGRVLSAEGTLVTVEITERGTLRHLNKGDHTTVGIQTIRVLSGELSVQPLKPGTEPDPKLRSRPKRKRPPARSVWAIPNNVGRGRRSR